MMVVQGGGVSGCDDGGNDRGDSCLGEGSRCVCGALFDGGRTWPGNHVVFGKESTLTDL